MDNNKGQTIFLSVIGIATLLVAIIGATFAYFSITVTGNEQASSIFVTTATLGQINFVDGTQINMEKVNLTKGGDDESRTKKFTVQNTAETALTSPVKYGVYLKITTNTISENANGSTGKPTAVIRNDGSSTDTPLTAGQDYFVYSIVADTTDAQSKVNAGDAEINIVNAPVPESSTGNGIKLTSAAEGTIDTGIMAEDGVKSMHVYNFTITLKNAANATQNNVQGKSFIGQLQVFTEN